ncbi:hypothetical protein [Roseovarius ramblicola]|uniref:Uncharacterized protein n=1 Tax=Roseovarius ramblicola TaxID=2022336 RepID=A0ABV5I478_9RHOB
MKGVSRNTLPVLLAWVLSAAPAQTGSPDSDKALEAWRAAGARPALAAMMADGALSPAESGIATRLANGIGTAQEVALPGGSVLTVTPREADTDLLTALSGNRIDLVFLWERDPRLFVQLAMLSVVSHRRLRRHAASRLYEFPAQADRLGWTLRQRLEDWYYHENLIGTTRAFMTNVEEAALARLSHEAMQMVAALEETDIQPESYDWLRCAHDPGAEC